MKFQGRQGIYILCLQLVIVLYTAASAAAKLASGYRFLSARFVVLYAVELALLAVYALMWQQAIKKFTLTTAYANRSISVFWALLFSVLVFGETVTLKNIIGIIVIFAGVYLVNTDKEEAK